MPELPEVETVRRKLESRLVGRRIDSAEVIDERWCSPMSGSDVEASLNGREIIAFGRRGKYLILRFEDDGALLMHLRMTGTLLYDAPDGQKYVRAALWLSDGHRVVFSDPRRFGTGLLLADSAQVDSYLAERLGPEPFDAEFTPAYIKRAAAGSQTPIKSFLLNQRKIAGIGNIYADEALFRARIHPLRPASRLDGASCERLASGVVESLQAGLDNGGATIDDFRDPDGVWGAYQSEFLVHRRGGLPCPNCSEPITKMVVGGRGTYCCQQCQPRPRTRRIKRP